MLNRKIYNWQCRDRVLKLGGQTAVMGILNVTPDSFSDGGKHAGLNTAVERALQMEAEGAAVIDIGGESTRPGAEPVSLADELERTIPVILKIREHSDVLISIDTTKAEVARQAIEAGAQIINDISALEADEKMAGVAAETKAGVVLMHRQGTPQTMQQNPVYENVVNEVCAYLQSRIHFAVKCGVPDSAIAIDPGIGFGKTFEHNLELLRAIPVLAASGYPVLIGASRKRFIGQILGRENPAERMAGSLGVAGWSAQFGAHILRVHDVIGTCDVCRIVDTLMRNDNLRLERGL